MQSIRLNFILLTSKLLLQKKSRVTFCKNSHKKKNTIKILSCDFDESESGIFQNRSMLSQDFTSNIFELREPKTGGKREI